MRCICPYCSKVTRQARNLSGPNFCPHCHGLFNIRPPEKIPPWILGVLVVMVANLQIMV